MTAEHDRLRSPGSRELPASVIAAAVTGSVVILVVLLFWHPWSSPAATDVGTIPQKTQTAVGGTRQLDNAYTRESAHYTVTSTADEAQTQQTLLAVEALHAAYSKFFQSTIPAHAKSTKHKLVLYRNRAQFQAHNTFRPWAEAYYRKPTCHAYFVRNNPNPYHWMIHEAAHQLNYELAGLNNPKWIEEGLGTYFGTSRIENGILLGGNIDPDTYPIWWLADFDSSGDLRTDIDSGNVIPLHALITGKKAPHIDDNVNRFYIHYWSLTHFLLHGQNGKYASRYKRLIMDGGSLEHFELSIGPLSRIEQEWYSYLQQKIAEARKRKESKLRNRI